MTTQEVASMVASIGVPYAYYQFPEGTEQATPFVCFFYSGSEGFPADDTNYQRMERLVIELYTDNKDFDLEKTVGDTLNDHGLVWTRDEEWIESERMLEVVFQTTICITEE